MASFKRHLQITSLASGMVSTTCLGGNLVTPTEAIILWVTGSIGGILPDIDSDSSTSLDIVFNSITLFILAMSLYYLHSTYSTPILWGGCILTYGLLNFIIRPAFEAVTVHRGIFHSVTAGIFFTFSVTNISFYFARQTTTFSWLLGLFLLFGFLIHLILDEIYSVDFNNNHIKRSLGSALKLISFSDLKVSSLMLLAVLGNYYIAPNPIDFYHMVTNLETLARIRESFLFLN